MSPFIAPPPARRSPPPPRIRLGAALLLVAALGACGRGGATVEITDVRDLADPPPPTPEMRTEQRLSMGGPESEGGPHGAGPSMGARPARAAFTWTAPKGWEELPPAPMRDVAWRVAGSPVAECSFSTLAGDAGGLAANVSRWRKQMGLGPVDAAAAVALPRGTLLGRPAIYVELSGTWQGMQGVRIEGAKLVGLVAELPQAMAFLKMTGPAAVVDAELGGFQALAASIRMASGTAAAPSDPAPAPPRGGAGVPMAKVPLRWTVPDGWSPGGERPMRLASFVPDKAPGTDVSVAALLGDGGGVEANLARWAGQMGRPPLLAAEVAALERAPVLGRSALFVSFEGTFGGMEGGAGKPGASMLGMVVQREDDVVFVKMTGPTEEVRGERERFRAFCASLHE